MRRLILGRIDKSFDPQRDIVLSPSSFAGRETLPSGWKSLWFPDALTRPDDVAAHWLKVRALANHTARRLGHELNRRHATAYSERFWRDVLILWLLLAIQASWTRFLELSAVIERWGSEPCEVEMSPAQVWAFADELDFMRRGIQDPAFDAWMCSLILRRIAPSGWMMRAAAAGTGQRAASPPPLPDRPGQVRRLLRRLLPVHRFDNVVGVGGVLTAVFALIAAALPARPASSPALAEPVDFAPERAFPAAYLEVLAEILQAAMPGAYTTAFLPLDRAAREIRRAKGKLTVTGATKYNPLNLIVKAHANAAGERIVQAQHGAGYGWLSAFMSQEIEYYFHAFISWGWREDDTGPRPAIDLPSPFLSRYRGTHRERNPSLVFAGTHVELVPLPFRGIPRGTQWLTYVDWKQDFIGALSKEAVDSLRYRPYQRFKSDFDEVAFIRQSAPGAAIIEKDFHAELQSCRLLVLDHPGTTLPIAMAAGTPLVCYWERDAWPMVSPAEPYFQKLRDAGILFDDPQAAARQVNAAWPDVASWWNRSDVRAARAAWAHQFARTSPVWWWHWIRAMASLDGRRTRQTPAVARHPAPHTRVI